MRGFVKRMTKKQKGFTLIELLVVIGILAVLIAVVALNVGRFIGRGACQACCVECHNVFTAAMAYFADNPDETEVAASDLAGEGGYLVGGLKYCADATVTRDGGIDCDAICSAEPAGGEDCRCVAEEG